MGLWDKIKGQFIDVIEWEDVQGSTLVWKFPHYDNAIKNGAQLIVRESQAAVFLHEGVLGDVFAPGRHVLSTNNIPILTTLSNWKYAFNEPFKCDIFFCSTRNVTNLKWGTANPIMLRDPEFGPIRLRAFGSYCMKVTDPGKFIKQIAGMDANFQVSEVDSQLRNMLVTAFTDALGEAKIPALDLAANYQEMGETIEDKIQPSFAPWGIRISNFLIENISLPPAVEEALDTRAKMGIIGNMQTFQQMKMGEAMGDMAKNQGAGGSMGLIAGMGMGNMMGGAMTNASAGRGAPPPPLPQATWHVALNGQQSGPFLMDALKNLSTSGQLGRETLVWKNGMATWTAAGQIPELAGLFQASGPPPLPGN